MKWAVSYITITLQYYLFKITGAFWSHQLAILMWNFRPIGNEEKYTTLWKFETSFNCLSWEHSTLWWHQGNITRNYSRFKSTERGSSIVSSCCVCASCIGSLMYPPFSPLVLVCWNWLHHFIALLPLMSEAMASLHNHCHDCLLTSRFAGPLADEVAAAWSLACGPDLFQQRWHCHPSQLRVNAPWL